MNKPHPRLAQMREYLEDAAETDRPWERWEYIGIAQGDTWEPCICQPNWDNRYKRFRRKSLTIRIGDYDVPEPMRKAPEFGSKYYIPIIYTITCHARSHVWQGDPFDRAVLAQNLCHFTREAAELHAKAILSFTRTDIDQ